MSGFLARQGIKPISSLPILPYDTGLKAYQQVVTQCAGLVLLLITIRCIKGLQSLVQTCSNVFDNCCAKCHSVLDQATTFTVNILHDTILPRLSTPNYRVFTRQRRRCYNARGCIRFANWCFHRDKNCSSGRHARFRQNINNSINVRGRFPYLRQRKTTSLPAAMHLRRRKQRHRTKQQPELVLTHCDKSDQDNDDSKSTSTHEIVP